MNLRRLLPSVAMLVIGLAIRTPEVKAASLPIDSGWTILESPEIAPIPTPGSPYVFDGGPWEVNTTAALNLTVTDFYNPGDLFEVWNNGILLGSGSVPNGLYKFANTPDDALGDPRFSQNSWLLQPGFHSLIFKSTKFAPTFTNTQIAFRAQTVALPEGGPTVLLLGMAVAGIWGIRSLRYLGMKHS
jgi:hypothetical protein